MNTAEYLKTEKVYRKRLSDLNSSILFEEERLKSVKESGSKKVVSIKKTIEVLIKNEDYLTKEISALKEDKIKKEKNVSNLEISIKSNKEDLKSSIQKRKEVEKQLSEKEKKVSDAKLILVEIEEKKETETKELEKMTKKRINVGQETQLINQYKEQVKRAFEMAGMKYPFS